MRPVCIVVQSRGDLASERGASPIPGRIAARQLQRAKAQLRIESRPAETTPLRPQKSRPRPHEHSKASVRLSPTALIPFPRSHPDASWSNLGRSASVVTLSTLERCCQSAKHILAAEIRRSCIQTAERKSLAQPPTMTPSPAALVCISPCRISRRDDGGPIRRSAAGFALAASLASSPVQPESQAIQDSSAGFADGCKACTIRSQCPQPAGRVTPISATCCRGHC